MSIAKCHIWCSLSLLFCTSPCPGEDTKPKEVTCKLSETHSIAFCWIPSGQCDLGSAAAHNKLILEYLGVEKPTKHIQQESNSSRGTFKTQGFWMSKHLVTQEDWVEVMGNERVAYYSKSGGGKLLIKGIEHPERLPMESVSQEDAVFYTQELNKMAAIGKAFGKGSVVALPTEDQWEYAAQGGKGNKFLYYWGDELNGTQANCLGTSPFGTKSEGPFLNRTSEVGGYAEKMPHPFGLTDMTGNVWQWCSTIYDKNEDKFVYRGGSWSSEAFFCRTACRSFGKKTYKSSDIGFRIIIEAKLEK